jgi:hypothetical protein
VHAFPPTADEAVARAALVARGDQIDQRSIQQIEAQQEWRSRRYREAGE